MPHRVVFLSSHLWDDERVDTCECVIGFEAHNSTDKGVMMVFYLTEVKKTTFGAREEVLAAPLSRIDHHRMSRPAASSRDDEELSVCLKPLIRMAVAAEK